MTFNQETEDAPFLNSRFHFLVRAARVHLLAVKHSRHRRAEDYLLRERELSARDLELREIRVCTGSKKLERSRERVGEQANFKNAMSKLNRLRMLPLRLPQNGLRAFEERLIARKLDFLLWGWNYICVDMVREWLEPQRPPTRGLRPHVDRWTVQDWAHALGRCAGNDGYLLFDSESVKVSKHDEAQFVELFKRERSTKNGYKTRDYKDRFRQTLAAALLQLLQPHRTSYITLWQVSFSTLR